MQAIDFATRLVKQISKTEFNIYQIGTLLSIAAGLKTAYDIERFFGLNEKSTIVSRALSKLYKEGYIDFKHDNFSGVQLYKLTEDGVDSVKELLSFLPTRAK